MVGSPFQTPETLAEDLKFIETFRPAMCGIGPFIPQKDTPFGDRPAGTAEHCQTALYQTYVRYSGIAGSIAEDTSRHLLFRRPIKRARSN